MDDDGADVDDVDDDGGEADKVGFHIVCHF